MRSSPPHPRRSNKPRRTVCGSGEKFRDQTYALFARYIKGQGVDPENPKCVVVAVSFKDRCHLLEAWNFEGLNTEALHLPAFAKDRFSV